MATIFKKLFNADTRLITSLKPIVKKINAFEAEMKALPDSAFPEKTASFKARIAAGESLDSILPEAFALVREAAFRTLGQRHYDVQLLGGIILFRGSIAEMRTGEGKTLVGTLPVYLRALENKGVHVVTVNDYLARRDGDWMGQIYAFLGLSVGVINGQNVSYLYDAENKNVKEDQERDETGSFKVAYEFLKQSSRAEAYAADITYGTNAEFGFDYLRDNLVSQKEQLVQRDHHFALVDEIDSILIDEARTPLIISSQGTDGEKLYETFAKIARSLVKDIDYTTDEKFNTIAMTDAGITKAEQLLGITDIYTEKGIKYVHHLETAVRAEALYKKDKEYVVKNGEVIIVDPFTGRLQPGRRWNDGLHQAVEAKEGVLIQKETRAAASITYQNFFKLYSHLAGMTGTAKTSEEEFLKVYGLPVVVVPTHRTIERKDNPDQIYQTEVGKLKAIAKKVKELHDAGRPILIGTISIEKNEQLAEYLKSVGVPHTLLNAKNHEREGEIIANAGKSGSVTIATNMAGRGVDIKLGGAQAILVEADKVKQSGGLFVLGTERHEARRIDNQLRGRAGRQGDPGETQFFVSLEDDLMRVFGADRIKNLLGKFNIPEDEPIVNGLISRTLESAQAKIEGFHFDARKYTFEYDNVLNHQRKSIYERRKKLLFADEQAIRDYLQTIIESYPEAVEVIKTKEDAIGSQAFLETARRIILYSTDIFWSEHLESMEYLRSSVNLRAYGQREPLVEYKKEGLRMFRDLEASIRAQVFELLKTIDVTQKNEIQAETPSPVISNSIENKGEYPKVGRNEPCPCGSGKKYKNCHGKQG